MRKAALPVSDLLAVLENFHGTQKPCWPVEPYEFIVWWHCGYPASDAACSKGWERLSHDIGIEPEQLLTATPAQLKSALKPGGMFPELRALRLKEIALRVKNEFGGDLRNALAGSITEARKKLKKFPSIADAGADRILLFGNLSPIAAVPSNCPHVLVRIRNGPEHENYNANYREAQQYVTTEVPEKFDARTRAYLLLKCHGQEICKRTKPRCDACPVSGKCALFAGGSGAIRSKSD
jgi:endonuclease III